jgi:hypothetical protein
VFDEQLAAFREHRRIEFEAEERAFYTEVLGPARERNRYRRLPQKLRRKAQEGNKKILKRAVKIASSVLGVHAVSALARGDKINVEGPNMTLQMQKSGFLTDMGMHAIDVAMLDHSGELLAKLCVYQDKVPAIDQAVGFALMVQSGMEKELVDEANIVTLTPAGQSNIIIAERQQRALQSVERMGAPALNCAQRNRIQFGHDQDRWWHRKYWEETKHIWIDTVTAAVLGPHRKMFNALAAQ